MISTGDVKFDFILKDIPSDGLEEEFDLEPRSRKSHVQGSLKVKVRLTAAQVHKVSSF